jgi:hypothetical protein
MHAVSRASPIEVAVKSLAHGECNCLNAPTGIRATDGVAHCGQFFPFALFSPQKTTLSKFIHIKKIHALSVRGDKRGVSENDDATICAGLACGQRHKKCGLPFWPASRLHLRGAQNKSAKSKCRITAPLRADNGCRGRAMSPAKPHRTSPKTRSAGYVFAVEYVDHGIADAMATRNSTFASLSAILFAAFFSIAASAPADATSVTFTYFRAAWSSTTTYSAGMVVTYNGASYISLISSNKNAIRM